MDHLVARGALRSLGLHLREPCSLRMFSRDIVSDDGGFTVKHHQQTLFDKNNKKDHCVELCGCFHQPSANVWSEEPDCRLAFQAWGGATSLAAELRGAHALPPLLPLEALN